MFTACASWRCLRSNRNWFLFHCPVTFLHDLVAKRFGDLVFKTGIETILRCFLIGTGEQQNNYPGKLYLHFYFFEPQRPQSFYTESTGISVSFVYSLLCAL